MQQHMQEKNWLYLLLPFFICGLAACFYLYEFILQVSPSVMTHELMSAFNIGAAGVGSLSAFYYYAYTPMQLPAGILYDRYGPRKIMFLAIFVCAVGAVFFGCTHNVFFASIGRFLMGAGSAFSFIGSLLLISRWFPPRQFAFISGLVQFMGSMGAIVGEVPLAAAISHYGWHKSIITIGMAGFVLSLIVFLVVRDDPPWRKNLKYSNSNEGALLAGLSQVLKNSQTWAIAVYSFCTWAPIVVFGALWGVSYLTTHYGVSTTVASSSVAMVWLGVGVGSPLIGWWSDHIGKRCAPLFQVQAFGLFAILMLLYVPNIPFSMTYFLLFIMGFAASGQSLSFGSIKDINRPEEVGTAIGFNNMAVVASGAALQPLASCLIQHYWDGTMHLGTPVYSLNAYQHAMIVLPLCYIVCMIVSKKWIQETNCKNTYETQYEPRQSTVQYISGAEIS